MGIEFRDGRYLRRVWLGKRTVKEGEAAAAWSLSGRHRQIIGPRREHLFFSTIRFLDRFTARNGEYLVVKNKNGAIEHVRGPVTMFLNPVYHDEIQIKQAIQLQSNSEAIVVYASESKEAKDASAGTSDAVDIAVTRRILKGPAVFVPNVGEWVQTFTWSKAGGKKDSEPHSVLNLGQIRHAVNCSLRTRDNVKVTVTISILVKLTDVDLMLSTTTDPIADLFAALQSDISAFGAGFSASELNNLGDAKNLSNLERYEQLFKAAKAVGFQVLDIIVTNFGISEELQRQQDEYNSKQSKLKAELAEAEQKQALADLELANRTKRADAERAMEKAELEHKLELEKLSQREEGRERMQRNKESIEFFSALKNLGVDLTQLLVTSMSRKNDQIPAGFQVMNPPALQTLRE